jgi:hypothetical protein
MTRLPFESIEVGPDIYSLRWGDAQCIDHAAKIITIPADTAPDELPAVVGAVVALAWRERLEIYADALLGKFEAFAAGAEAIADPDFELSEDDGPQFVAAFDELVRLGVRFDPTFASTVRGCKQCLPDSDSFVDGGMSVDDALEDDDPDLDMSDCDSDGETRFQRNPVAPLVAARREWLARQEASRSVGANLGPVLSPADRCKSVKVDVRNIIRVAKKPFGWPIEMNTFGDAELR